MSLAAELASANSAIVGQSVIVNVRLAVSAVAPPGARSVIVSVGVDARSARISHETDWEPPGATVGSACVAVCGFSRRMESVGVNVARAA